MTRELITGRALTCLAAAAAAAWLTSAAAASAGHAQAPPTLPAPTRTAASPMPAATPVPTGAVRITVSLVRGAESVPGDDSVAWLPGIPAGGRTASGVRIAQRGKQFEPRIAVVPIGSTVEFPNYDRVFHNVFSLSKPKTFDLGLYRSGKSESVRFDEPGQVQVYCNIHPHMTAYLMVVDSRHYAIADGRGEIVLDEVPPGRHLVEGWNARSGLWSREVAVGPGRTTRLDVELDISSWREKPHLNKHGKEYPPPDDDDFRY